VPLAVETDSKTSDGHVNGMASEAQLRWLTGAEGKSRMESGKWKRPHSHTITDIGSGAGKPKRGRTFATSLISFIAFNNFNFHFLQRQATKTCAD